jgi:hypothetical protein
MTFLDTVRYFPQFHFAFHMVHRVLLLRMRNVTLGSLLNREGENVAKRFAGG